MKTQLLSVVKLRLEQVKRFIESKDFESAALFAGSVEQHYPKDAKFRFLIEALVADDYEDALAAINDLLFECSDLK